MDIMLERVLTCMSPRYGAGKELADALGISPNVITNWKSGKNKSYRRYAKQIAAYYGVSLDYLTGAEKEKDLAESGKADDKLIAFYGECKPYLTKDDIDDIALFMRMKAERKKEKGET